jgi:phosphoenolpyruvate carboxykinase (ATP)
MRGERLDKYNTKVYLVNTGWTGGPYGVGNRMKLKYTRAMVTAALNGSIEKSEFIHDELFNLEIPTSIADCPSEILNPKDTWKNKNEYDEQAKKLTKMFKDNFDKKYPHMPDEIKNAGPKA